MKRSPRPPYRDNRGYDKGYDRGYDRSPASRGDSPKSFLGLSINFATIALLGGVFILGIGLGMSWSLSSSNNAVNVASREVIDRSAPNPEICQQFGASAIVTDMKVFVTLNPFNVYVNQPIMQPGCVLRRNNWSILEQKKLVTRDEVKDCKNRMNTFGFTGTLDGGSPNIACIYQNDAAGNLFLNKPGSVDVTAPPESENF